MVSSSRSSLAYQISSSISSHCFYKVLFSVWIHIYSALSDSSGFGLISTSVWNCSQSGSGIPDSKTLLGLLVSVLPLVDSSWVVLSSVRSGGNNGSYSYSSLDVTDSPDRYLCPRLLTTVVDPVWDSVNTFAGVSTDPWLVIFHLWAISSTLLWILLLATSLAIDPVCDHVLVLAFSLVIPSPEVLTSWGSALSCRPWPPPMVWPGDSPCSSTGAQVWLLVHTPDVFADSLAVTVLDMSFFVF